MMKFISTTIKEYLSENINRDEIKQITLDDAISLSQLSDVKDVGEWLNKPIEDINYYYKEEPISMFTDDIKDMVSTYYIFPYERDRTNYIINLLRNKSKPMAIFVELNDKNSFILEGRHRIVAFYCVGLDKVPVVYVE